MKPKIFAFILTHNCATMIEKAYKKIPKDFVSEIIVSDDKSSDSTIKIAKSLGLKVISNTGKKGYGGNLKCALKYCFAHGADYAVEIQGDGAQFNPQAIKPAYPLMLRNYDLILGSRFLFKGQALKNGMPVIRFIANRTLSFFDRIVLKLPLTEFHTGFRIYSKKLYKLMPLEFNANNYLFSFEVIAQAAYYNLKLGEVPVEADYISEHTSHGLLGASIYAINTFYILFKFLLARNRIYFSKQFPNIK